MIKYVDLLLRDEVMEKYYDERTSERLVQYMYQWKMN